MLGDRFVDRRRLAEILQSQGNLNTGDPFGGLAHVLQQYLIGRETGRERQEKQAAMGALTQGASAKPWVNPDTGETMGEAGGLAGAQYALSQLQGNPTAGRLSSQLMMQQIGQDAENRQWEDRFNTQNQAQMDRFRMEQEAADRRFQQQLAAQRELAQMKAEQDRATSGKYYAVPSGDGYFLIDKASGMAVRMGMDQAGNPVQIGAPFQPAFNPGTGQPSPLPVPPGGPQMMPGAPQPNAGMQPPAAMSADPNAAVQSPGMPQQPAGELRPVMPPSVDPRAQYDVSSAKKAGQLEGERIGSMPERQRAASNALRELEAQHGVVLQNIDKAINLANTGGGPVGATGFGSYLSSVPTTDARDLAATLDTIKANIGFDKLQAMREASPTGGALGQVSERENLLLQSVLGSMDQGQSREQFVQNLERIRDIIKERGQARRAAFDSDFGQPQQAPQQFMPQQNTPPQNGGWSIQRID